MKLTEAMGKQIGINQGTVRSEGTPCPICHERTVEVYVYIAVRERQLAGTRNEGPDKGPAARKLKNLPQTTAFPTVWQGTCRQCAFELRNEIAERLSRYDKVIRDGEDQE